MRYSDLRFDVLPIGQSTDVVDMPRQQALARARRYSRVNNVIIEANGRDGAMVFTRKK